jgi:hypothetical protein
MSLDKLIAAATDYFTTGADVHRRALAGGGGKITDLSEKPTETKPAKAVKVKEPEITDVVAKSEPVAPAKVAEVVEKQPAPTAVEEPEDDLDGPSYEEDIRPLVRSKSLSNRNGVIALLGSFGVKAGSELTTAQHAAFFAGLKAL